MVDSEKDAAVAKKLGKRRRSRKGKVAREKRLTFPGVWLGIPGSPLFLTENHAQLSERGGGGLLCTYLKNRTRCWRKGGIGEQRRGWGGLRQLLVPPLPTRRAAGRMLQHQPPGGSTGRRPDSGCGWGRGGQ